MNVLLPVLALSTLQAQQVQRYGLVNFDGSDTSSIERVTRQAGELRSEILIPNRARLKVVAELGTDGCVTGITEDVLPWGYAADATPLSCRS